MGDIPSRWRGICQEGEKFNHSHCNRLVIYIFFCGLSISHLISSVKTCCVPTVLLLPTKFRKELFTELTGALDIVNNYLSILALKWSQSSHCPVYLYLLFTQQQKLL